MGFTTIRQPILLDVVCVCALMIFAQLSITYGRCVLPSPIVAARV